MLSSLLQQAGGSELDKTFRAKFWGCLDTGVAECVTSPDPLLPVGADTYNRSLFL